MKKIRILMGALALAIVAAVIIACTKKKDEIVSQSVNGAITVSKEDDMNTYLKQFKEKMQSATKGDESLLMEDARWHLEALLNYTYGDAGYQISEIQHDTFYYKIPANGNLMTLSQLNDAFIVFSNHVEEVYEKCYLPEKRIFVVQAKFMTNESKEGSISARIVLSVGGVTTMYQWFDSTDYWSDQYYEDQQGNVTYAGGKCGPYEGQCPNSGAPKELGRLSNMRIPRVDCGNGYRVYFTDVVDVWLDSIYESDYMEDENSPCGYKIYLNFRDPYIPYTPNCICPDDMNYYLSKFPEIMNHYQPNGKHPIFATYECGLYLSGNWIADMFQLIIQYGTAQCVLNNPEM